MALHNWTRSLSQGILSYAAAPAGTSQSLSLERTAVDAALQWAAGIGLRGWPLLNEPRDHHHSCDDSHRRPEYRPPAVGDPGSDANRQPEKRS